MSGIRSHPLTKACKALNAARGVVYPEKGYTYFADVRGDGTSRPSLWVIINEHGGVASSTLNRATRKETLAVVERMTAKARDIEFIVEKAPAFIKR